MPKCQPATEAPILFVFIISSFFLVVGCGRHKTLVLPVSPQGLYRQGLDSFHLGTLEGYQRAVDSFRKAQALEPEICEYRLNLVQSLFFVATEQSLNLVPHD